MNAAKSLIKKILPESAVRSLADTRDALMRLKDLPDANFHPWRRAAIQRMADFKDVHKGERCFLIGNGPSLRQTDMSKLRNEYTIGVNRIYLMFPEIGYQISYYLCVNELVIEQCANDIKKLTMPKFLSWHAHRFFQPANDLLWLYTTYTGPVFSKDIRKRVWEGATVTYVGMQLAYYLGFSNVYLIGVDHNYITQGKPNTTITSQGEDPNHFAGGYFGKGFRWQLPDLETSERSYEMAKQAYTANGRQLIDATVGGKLTIFPKVDFGSLF